MCKRTEEHSELGPIYDGGTINQQKIKTRIRNNIMHVYYCQSQFNQTNVS